MNQSFETLVLPADFYMRFFSFSVKGIIGIFLVCFIVNIILKRKGAKVKIPMAIYINLPKMVISFLAIVLVFFCDYENKQFLFVPNLENMLVSTFIVGILAVIELLTCIAVSVQELCDIND